MKEYKRLTEILDIETNEIVYQGDIATILKRLCDLEDKIENGTLKDTLVKVGDTIYYAKYYDVEVDNDIKGVEILEPWEVERIDIYKDYIIYRLTHNSTDDYNTARDNEFGECWFADREKAHEHIAKLKELQNER